MKTTGSKNRKLLLNRQWKRWFHELKRRRKGKRKKRSGFKRKSFAPKVWAKRKKIAQKEFVEIRAPESMDLFENPQKTITFIDEIRKSALEKERPVHLILDDITYIHPSAMLVLVAEIYRCIVNEKIPGTFTGTYPKEERIEKILQATGFFKLLTIKHRLPDPKTHPLEYIKFVAGDKTQGEKWVALWQSIFGAAFQINLMPRQHFFKALTEAMANVIHHAYPENMDFNFPVLKSHWWLLGHVNKETKEFMVMFFDQGIGIPSSLVKRYDRGIISKILSSLSLSGGKDEDLLQVAMNLGESKTSESYRGKGLMDIQKIIEECQAGSLKILSGKGQYHYTNNEVISKSNRFDLGGTFIQWEIPLNLLSDNF